MRRPVVIEFAGVPNAGKGFHTKNALRTLPEYGIKTKWITDQVWQFDMKDEVEKIRSAARQGANLISAARDQDYDLIIIERGGWAHVASLLAHHRDTNGSVRGRGRTNRIEEALKTAQELTGYEDAIVLIEVSTEEALRRDGATRAGVPSGKIANESFINLMQQGYLFVKEVLKSSRIKKKIVNGERQAEEVQKEILEFLVSLTKT